MSSPARRSQSADPLERNKLHEAIADLSRVSSTTSDIFLDCEETDDGLMAVLKNIQYCLHKALTKSSTDQLKMADRLLKKDCNKNLELAIKRERSKMGSQMVKLINGTINSNQGELPKLIPFDDTILPCSDQDFEKLNKMVRSNYPRFNSKDKELLFFLREIAEIRETYNITDRQIIRLISNRFTDRLLSYFLSEYYRDKDMISCFNDLALNYTDPIRSSVEIEKYIAYKFKFRDLSSELTELKQIISLSHPYKTKSDIMQIYLQKVISLLPLVERQALISDLDQREELLRQNLIDSPYTSYEIDQRILYHCKNLTPFNSRSREVYKVSECDLNDRETESPQANHLIECLAMLKEIRNDMNKSSKLFSEKIRLNNKEPSCTLYYPSDEEYDDVISEIKRNDGIKYLGQKISLDIKNCNPNIREALRLIRLDRRPSERPYQVRNGRGYLVDPEDRIDFPIFKREKSGNISLTKEALNYVSQHCYICGQKSCMGKNSDTCIYSDKQDNWEPCNKCSIGFHHDQHCLAIVNH